MASKIREKAFEIYKSVSTRQEFMVAVRKLGKSENYNSAMWNEWRQTYPKPAQQKKNIITRQSANSKPTEQSTPVEQAVADSSEQRGEDSTHYSNAGTSRVQEITPDNVVPESSEKLEESEVLKLSYQRKLQEMGVKSTDSLLKTSQSERESIQNPNAGTAKPNEGLKNTATTALNVNYGNALSYALKGLNNQLLFPERPMTEDDTKMIDDVSQDIRTRRFADLEANDPDSDIKMALMAEGIILIERIDLIPAKIRGVVGFVKEMKELLDGGNQSVAPQSDTPKEPVKPVETPKTDSSVDREHGSQSKPGEPVKETPKVAEPNWDNLTPNLRSWAESVLNAGGKVSPNLTSGAAVDMDAFRSKNILRNQNDSWSG